MSGNVTEITDVSAQALALLIPEYQETPRWQAWISSVMDSIQELESAAADVWGNVLNLDDAVGDQLDLLGRIVQEARDGRSDTDYRRALSVRVLVNRSQGRVEQLIQIARVFTSADLQVGAVIRLQEVQPAAIEIRVVRTPVTTRGELDRRLRKAKAGGVKLSTIIHPGGPNGSFFFIDSANYPEKVDTGFSDGPLGALAGGQLADVLG